MSRSTKSPSLRIASLALAALAMPLAVSRAQDPTPERALVNVIPRVSPIVVIADEPAPAIDGERALLNRPNRDAETSAAAWSDTDSQPIDGERALLGRVASSGSRRLVLAQ